MPSTNNSFGGFALSYKLKQQELEHVKKSEGEPDKKELPANLI